MIMNGKQNMYQLCLYAIHNIGTYEYNDIQHNISYHKGAIQSKSAINEIKIKIKLKNHNKKEKKDE